MLGREIIQRAFDRRKYEAQRAEAVRLFRQARADFAPYSPYAEALRGAIVGAPADPETFG